MPKLFLALLLALVVSCSNAPPKPTEQQQQYLDLIWQQHDTAVMHARAAAEVAYLMALADSLDDGPAAPEGLETYAVDYADTVGAVKESAAHLQHPQDESDAYQAAALFGAALQRFDNMRRDGITWPSFRENN